MKDGGTRRQFAGGYFYASLGLSDNGLPLLRDFIAQRSGTFFSDDQIDLLGDKTAELITALGLRSFLDFYYMLKYDDTTMAHWASLQDRLAVPETYFWRQPEHFTALTESVIPEIARLNPGKPIRIWSAACCSGEEPLSIAMALEESGLLRQHQICISASDASQALIATARAGVYGERSFRQLDPVRRARFFKPHGNGWRVNTSLHSMIRFSTANLMDPAQVAPLAAADIIFCRNVFIYFADQGILRVVRSFAEAMPTPGYLFVGAAESLMRLPTQFTLEDVANAFVYVKRSEVAAGNG